MGDIGQVMLSTDPSSREVREVRNPAELLALADPIALRTAVSEYVVAKHWAHGYEVLTPFEHTIRLAFDCARHEDHGTLLAEAFRGKERCSELVAVLEEIGARHAAAALWRAHVLCAAVPAERAASASTPDDWCNLIGHEEVVALESMFVESEVWDRILLFVTVNRHRFRPD